MVEKLEEIKRLGIIKDFTVINKVNDITYDILFYDSIPPEKALLKLDSYLAEIGVLL